MEKSNAVLLVIGPACPHCAAMIETLSELVKTGEISRLEIINAAKEQEWAQTMGIRSVPWVKLDDNIQLLGVHSAEDIRQWLEKIRSGTALKEYVHNSLKSGQLEFIVSLVRDHESKFKVLLELLSDPLLDMKSKLGIAAIMETIQGSDVIKASVPGLAALLDSDDVNTQIDCLYYLSLSGSVQAVPYVRKYLHHSHPALAEAAREALDELSNVD